MRLFSKKTFFFFIVFIAGALLTVTTPCRGEMKKIPLATGEYAPFVSKNMAQYGCVSQVITEVLKEMNMEPEYLFYPWPRCERSVEKGETWGAFPYAYTEQRAQKFWFSIPLVRYKSRFFYYKKKPVEFNILEDLNAYRIGGVLGYWYEEMFKAAGLHIDYAPSEESVLKMLVAGRVDLVPFNEVIGWHLIKKKFPDEVKNFGTLQKPLNDAGLSLIVSKVYPDSQSLLEQFNLALENVKRTPFYQDLMKQCNISAVTEVSDTTAETP